MNKNISPKRLLKSALAALLVLSMACLSACGDDSPKETEKPQPDLPTPGEPDKPQETPPVPGLSFSSITLPNEGDSFACNIYGLTAGEWNAESDQSWCAVSVSGNILKINAAPNSEGSSRTAQISIINVDRQLLGKVAVNQTSATEPESIESNSETKHTFFPIFTATWCPYSPNMDRTLVEIQKRWNYPILPMRIHVANSELYIPLASELAALYGNKATPTVYFENYFMAQNVGDGNVSVDYFWNLVMYKTNSGGYCDKCSTIACKASMSDDTITAEISVKAIQTGSYRLLTFILEDNIIKPQMSKTLGEIPDYCHNAVLVGALTPAEGQLLELTEPVKTLTMSGAIPSGVDKTNLRLLIVLERDDAQLNFSDNCWFADNCLSVTLGKSAGSGYIENIHIGDEINN